MTGKRCQVTKEIVLKMSAEEAKLLKSMLGCIAWQQMGKGHPGKWSINHPPTYGNPSDVRENVSVVWNALGKLI